MRHSVFYRLGIVRCASMVVVAASLVGASCGEVTDPDAEVVTVGALVPLSGGQSALGEAVEASLTLAADIINASLEDAESPWRVNLRIEDSRSDPELAFEKLRAMSEDGVRVVVGPFDTDSIVFAAPLADRLSTVLLACAPVLPDTEDDNDRLGRMFPALTREVDAVAEELNSNGVKHVAFVGRDGDWSVAYIDMLADKLIDRGGTVRGTILYDPNANDINDFTDEMTELAGLLGPAINSFGSESVGVFLLTQDEGVQLFEQADAASVLGQVRWFGSSGMSRIPEVLASSDARSFAAATSYTAPLFYEVDSNGYQAVEQGVRDAIGRDVPSSAVVAYDALWIAALTINQVTNRSDPILLRGALPNVLNGYAGVTGSFAPDGDGNRAEGGYDLWTVRQNGANVEWVKTTAFEPPEE
ncbi:MAG: ABC transporter substrate-binding protein [Phycisphaerales bacterium]|nr:ABC transporter substrate-binding protein [Phycisphaerales bacterium]